MLVLAHVTLVGHLNIVWSVIFQGDLVGHIILSHIHFLEMQFKNRLILDFQFNSTFSVLIFLQFQK